MTNSNFKNIYLFRKVLDKYISQVPNFLNALELICEDIVILITINKLLPKLD